MASAVNRQTKRAPEPKPAQTLTCIIDAPSHWITLAKLRPRIASLRFSRRPKCNRERTSLNTRHALKNPGGLGAGPQGHTNMRTKQGKILTCLLTKLKTVAVPLSDGPTELSMAREKGREKGGLALCVAFYRDSDVV